MSGRTPEELLGELGEALFAPRPRRRWWRWNLAALIAGLVLVPAAVATRLVWAPEPDVPAAAKPAGAPRPSAVTASTYVAQGKDWRLARATCTFAHHRTVVLHLTTPTGGAGRRCDALTPAQAQGPVTPPMVYTDPKTYQALLFGAVPAGITRVQALIHRSAQRKTILKDIPLQRTFFITQIPRDATVLTLVGLDAHGEPRLRCDPQACTEEHP